MIKIKNKNFNKKLKTWNKDINNDLDCERYYLFMSCLRKELLSDIFKYEDFFSNQIIINFKIMSYSIKDLKRFLEGKKPNRPKLNYDYILAEVRKNRVKKIIEIFEKKSFSNFQNTKIRILFSRLSFTSKIHFIKNLDKNILIKSMDIFLEKKYIDFFDYEINIQDIIKDFYIPCLEYIRDLRNVLAHNMIVPSQDALFEKAFNSLTDRKYNHSFLIKVFSDQLKIIFKESFYERFKKEIIKNYPSYLDIFEKVMNQPIYKKI